MNIPVISGTAIPALRGQGTAGVLALTTDSAASSAFTEAMLVCFRTSADCFIQIAAAPTAVTTGASDAVYADEWSLPYWVLPGEKVAGIVAASTATLRWVKVG